MRQRLKVHGLDPESGTDGQVPVISGGKFVIGNPPPSGITVQDENGTVATGVTQIDFQGAGVTAAAGTGEVVVTIAGGGGNIDGGSPSSTYLDFIDGGTP